MQIRILGLPAEVDAAIDALRRSEGLAVVAISQPYPWRGDTRQVRRCVTALTVADLPSPRPPATPDRRR